jgi:hypothetical protein
MATPEEQEKNTSLASAFSYALDQPLENIGTTLDAMGFEDSGKFLKDLTEAPENYESAAEGFLNRNGFLFDVGFLPRAVVEQAGQLAGSIATRIAGGAAGAAVGGPIGAITGAIAAPTLFEAAQIAGPVALARAKANGRDEPNWEDWSGAGGTALGSGLLNAFGVYGIGKLNSTVYGSAMREGVTEGLQGLGEQIGSTLLTDAGLQIDPKAAAGEALIGGTVGGVAQTPSSIYASTRQEIEAEEVGETPLLPAPVAEEPSVAEPVVAEQPTTDEEPIILPPPPIDYERMSIRDVFANAQDKALESNRDLFIAGRSMPRLEEEFLALDSGLNVYPYADVMETLTKNLERYGDSPDMNLKELADFTKLNLQDTYDDKFMERFDAYVNEPGKIEAYIENLRNRFSAEEEFDVEDLTPNEIAEIRESFRMYLGDHRGEIEEIIRQQSQVGSDDVDYVDTDSYINALIEDELESALRNKQTRLEGELKFVKADKRFLNPDYRKLNYTPRDTPSVLLADKEALRLEDNIETLGGGDLLADLQIDPNFASVSVVRNAIKNMPAEDKAINYYNELTTGNAKEDKLAQQEIEDSELDKFLKLKGEEKISVSEIDSFMEGYMAGTVVESVPIAHGSIGLNHDAKNKGFELNHTYLPRLNPKQEEKIKNVQRSIENAGVGTDRFEQEDILKDIANSTYANTNSHFTSKYGRPLFWVRGASGTLYRNNNDQRETPDPFGRVENVRIIHEIQNDYAQETRDPDESAFTKRFIDKQTPRYEEYKDKTEMLSLVTRRYSDFVKPDYLYPPELRGEDDGLYTEYSDLKNIRQDAAEGYIDARKIPRSQYNPMINFAILAHDTELPKRFYDGSVRQSLINAEKKVDKLRDERDKAGEIDEGETFDDFYDLQKQLNAAESEIDVLRKVVSKQDYLPPKNVTLVVDVLQARFSRDPTAPHTTLGPTATRRPNIPSYLGGMLIPGTQFTGEGVTLKEEMLHDIEKENFADHIRFIAQEVNKGDNQKGSAGARIKELATQMGRDVDISGIKTEAEVEAFLADPGVQSRMSKLENFSTAFDFVVPRELQAQIGTMDQLNEQLATRTHNKLQTKKKIAEAYKEAAQRLIKNRPQVEKLFLKIAGLKNIEEAIQDPVLRKEPPKGYQQYKGGMTPVINQPFTESYVRKGVLSTIIDALKKGDRYVAVPNDQTQRDFNTGTQTTAGGTYNLATQELRDIAAKYDLPVLDLYVRPSDAANPSDGLMATIDLEPLREIIASGDFKGFTGYKKGGVVKAPPALYKVDYGDYGRSYK